ncbi:hypothetical protein M621_19655 [Serratia plymuthica S13]|uniref:Uncharacterized protein n=1 Tax=Serratia plymuthica S13 TaxID=1348660 RepID=S4YR44_SERPL|nr:hypothetical protein M621_19655 [Serratia plymuthica S13]
MGLPLAQQFLLLAPLLAQRWVHYWADLSLEQPRVLLQGPH